MQLLLKILSEKANSVDPDQTAPDLVLQFAYAMYTILGNLIYIRSLVTLTL